MARRKPSISNLQNDLHALGMSVPEDVSLPSLRGNPPRLRGHAFRYYVALPMYSSEGNPVFTYEHLGHLYGFFDLRFGGCTAPSSRSGAPIFGEYQPPGAAPVRDYHTFITVYANPIEVSDRLFEKLKEILRKAPLIPQDEILMERSEVYLL